MLLTVKELSQQPQIKPSTPYAWAKQGNIPCCTPNGLIRLIAAGADRWKPQHYRLLTPGTPKKPYVLKPP